MPVASGSGAPRYVPPVDERDQGELPDHQRLISYHLAKFLRHEAPKKRLDDWVDVETIIAELERGHTLSVRRDDLMAVVQNSRSKEVRRFEDQTDPATGKTWVRAANADHYRTRGSKARGSRRGDNRDDRSDCSDWSDWSRAGSTASRPSNGRKNRSWRPMGSYAERDYGGSAKFPEVPENAPASGSASWPEHHDHGAGEASPTSFDGAWVSKEGAENSISGTTLLWQGQVDGVPFDPIVVYIRDKKIWVPENTAPESKTQWIAGWLEDSGQVISFYDGDIWRRKAEAAKQEEASAAPTEASAYADTKEAGDQQAPGAGAEGAGSSSTDVPPSTEGGNDWVDMRVRMAFDAAGFGDDYLSLQKGELLSVRPALEDGWMFGYSYQREKYGWFPPTYAYTDRS